MAVGCPWSHVLDDSQTERKLVDSDETQLADGASGDLPDKVPLTARLLLRESLTARRAAGIIAGFTILITVGGGILERVVDIRSSPRSARGSGSRCRR